jgi:predicted PurR-regulated permease PerM
MTAMDLALIGFAFLVIVSCLYTLSKWGILAGIIVAIPMIGSFVALARATFGE